MMTHLLEWRNPQGSEERFITHPEENGEPERKIWKLVVTELGLGLLAAAALVETVAYAILVACTLPTCCCKSTPCPFFAEQLESSLFTVIWAIRSCARNPFYVNLLTTESSVRIFIFEGMLCRPVDRAYVAGIGGGDDREEESEIQELMLQERIDRGAEFLKNEVLSGANADTLRDFQEVSSNMITLVAAKAIYIYAAGSKRECAVPDFFKPATRRKIETLRTELTNKEMLGQLQLLMSDLEQLQLLTKDPRDDLERFAKVRQNQAILSAFNDTDVHSAFNKLRGVASEEAQGENRRIPGEENVLTRACWIRVSSGL